MTAPHDSTGDELDLVSMYLNPPVSRAHGMALRLGPEKGGNRKGVLALDPNHCGLDAWGDRTGCTKMAIHALEVETTRMRTYDEAGLGRVLHRVSSRELHDEKLSLIEHPAAGLWYLVDERENDEPRIVPLFSAAVLRAAPAKEPAAEE
jgi:predicted metalloprotease